MVKVVEADGNVARFSRRVNSSRVIAEGMPSVRRRRYVSAYLRDSGEVRIGWGAFVDIFLDVDDDACAESFGLAVAPLLLAVLFFMGNGLKSSGNSDTLENVYYTDKTKEIGRLVRDGRKWGSSQNQERILNGITPWDNFIHVM